MLCAARGQVPGRRQCLPAGVRPDCLRQDVHCRHRWWGHCCCQFCNVTLMRRLLALGSQHRDQHCRAHLCSGSWGGLSECFSSQALVICWWAESPRQGSPSHSGVLQQAAARLRRGAGVVARGTQRAGMLPRMVGEVFRRLQEGEDTVRARAPGAPSSLPRFEVPTSPTYLLSPPPISPGGGPNTRPPGIALCRPLGTAGMP